MDALLEQLLDEPPEAFAEDTDPPLDFPPQPNLNSPMVFEHHENVYRLRFARWTDHRNTHPFTTLEVLVWSGDRWRVYRTTTVGCYHRDRFTKEDGRKAALRLVMKTIRDTEMKARIWDAYLGR